MKTFLHAPEKGLGLCLVQAGLILMSIILPGFLIKNPNLSFVLLLTGGWLIWTFAEYAIHRFLMHELVLPGKKSDILNHQRHHQHPHDLKVKAIHRFYVLVIGIGISIIAFKLQNAFTILAGFFLGFLIYNYLHLLLHHPFGALVLPKIQRAHILHHTRYPNRGYSFSTILWDWLFETLPPENAEITEKMKQNFFGLPGLDKKKKDNPRAPIYLQRKSKRCTITFPSPTGVGP